jgi:hypothetical protein
MMHLHLKSLQKDINCLNEVTSNRTFKRRILETLKQDIIQPTLEENNAAIISQLLHALAPCLARLLKDPVEKCRELASRLLVQCVNIIFTISIYFI